MEAETIRDGGPFLTIKSARVHLDATTPEDEIPVVIRGVVVKTWSKGNSAGRWLDDLTGRANVIVDRQAPAVDLSELKVGTRVLVLGSAYINSRQQTNIKPNHIDIVQDGAPTGRLQGPVPVHIITSFLLCRMRHVASAAAHKAGYTEFEPYYLTTGASERIAEPLMVSFPGWGGDLELAPSPAPQLLATLLESGESRVFSIARCFTSAYRDGFSSAEKLVLVARQLGGEEREVAALATLVLQAVLRDGDTQMAGADWFSDEWEVQEVAGFHPRSTTVPLIEWSGAPGDAGRQDVRVLRILFPPGVVVAEGDVTPWSSDLTVAAVTIHLERLISLVGPHKLAQLRNLAAIGNEA